MSRRPRPVRDAVQVAPVCPPRVKHFARALEEAGRLRALVTLYAHRPGGWLERLGAWADRTTGSGLVPRLRGRTVEGVDPRRCRPSIAAAMLYCTGQTLARSTQRAIAAEDRMFAAIDRLATRRAIPEGTALVLGREDGCLSSFQRAKQVGARTVYDLPTAHHTTVRRILEREEALFPNICTLPGTRSVFTPRRTQRKRQELSAADLIVVGSAFVRRSLVEEGYAAERIVVLPSGCDDSWAGPRGSGAERRRSPVVLHVAHLGVRKGTHRLLRVWRRLKAYRHFRLRLVGDMCLSRRFLADYRGCYEHAGRLDRSALAAEYRAACLFVLPAAAEGCAAVILEALSCGVPIVVSRNSGAEGFIEPGREGLLHDFGDDDELAARLDWVLSHPLERVEMGRAARRKAEAWTWREYRARFLAELDEFTARQRAAA